MLLMLQEQSRKRNMLEGELEDFLQDTRVSEFELDQIYEGGMPHDINFTVIKGEIKESNFSYNLMRKNSTEFKNLEEEFFKSLLELNNSLDMRMIDLKQWKIQFDRTDDCRTTFQLVLPWLPHPGMFKLQEAVDGHISYQGMLGGLLVEKVVVEDFCRIRERSTAYKG